MNFIRDILFVITLVALPLWAKTSYFFLPVHLEGVHEDHAQTILSLTREYIESDGDKVASNKSDCDYLLQIKLILKEKGVAVVYEKRNKNNDSLWSYSHIAYSPEDFVPVATPNPSTENYPWDQPIKKEK